MTDMVLATATQAVVQPQGFTLDDIKTLTKDAMEAGELITTLQEAFYENYKSDGAVFYRNLKAAVIQRAKELGCSLQDAKSACTEVLHRWDAQKKAEARAQKASDKQIFPWALWSIGLDRSSPAGKAHGTITNALTALDACPDTKGILRYNLLTHRVEVVGAKWAREGGTLDDYDVIEIRHALEPGGLTGEKIITDGIMKMARRRAYHPVKQYLEGITWDGKPRLQELLPKYLGADRCDYTTAVTRLIFGWIINRLYRPGCKFDTMPILVDRLQGGGKSTLIRMLAIEDQWYVAIRDVSDRKEAVETMMGHFVCEMEELEGLVIAKNVETVRAFLSCAVDPYRIPYDRFSKDIARQCIFIGTSNDVSCLPMDRAGNRRFVPIKVDKARAVCHPLDDEKETRDFVMQCYAEAMVLYRKGGLPTKLPAEWEKQMEERQQSFLPEDIKKGIIEQWVKDNWRQRYCVLMIFREALRHRDDEIPKQFESKEIAAILDSLKWDDGQPILQRYPGSKNGDTSILNSQGGVDARYGRQRAWVHVLRPEYKPGDKGTWQADNGEPMYTASEPVYESVYTGGASVYGAGGQMQKSPAVEYVPENACSYEQLEFLK